jgi:hypothetical protein
MLYWINLVRYMDAWWTLANAMEHLDQLSGDYFLTENVFHSFRDR